MQIGAATQFANSSTNTSALRAGSASNQADQDDTQSSDGSTNVASSTSQDDAVQISPQGYAAASTDDIADSADGASDAIDTSDTSDDGGSDAIDTSDTSDATSTPATAQPVKSLVYGALGLERPDAPADPNHTYTLGRWIAAGITLGGIISLFI